jgi:hypothetical protein
VPDLTRSIKKWRTARIERLSLKPYLLDMLCRPLGDEEMTMTRRASVFAFVAAAMLALSGGHAMAGIGIHVEAAIEHAQEAIEDGAKGDSKEVVTHVMSALGHAREALHEKALERDRAANKLLHRAIRHLRLAEMRARFGDTTRAVKHATSALAELKKIK